MGSVFCCCGSSKEDEVLRINYDRLKEEQDEETQPIIKHSSHENFVWNDELQHDLIEARKEIRQYCYDISPIKPVEDDIESQHFNLEAETPQIKLDESNEDIAFEQSTNMQTTMGSVQTSDETSSTEQSPTLTSIDECTEEDQLDSDQLSSVQSLFSNSEYDLEKLMLPI